MDWLTSNKEWLFSGVGLLFITVLYKYFVPWVTRSTERHKEKESTTINFITNAIDTNKIESASQKIQEKESPPKKTLAEYKETTRILFIDDDIKFKVAKILVRSGWKHTKLVKDVDTLEDPEITDADILFIDVQGVGVLMGFNDEGLGLALAIKEKYTNKKVVIYSAQTEGNRFHSALRKADSSLPKNADPYEFQRIVEEFTIGGGAK